MKRFLFFFLLIPFYAISQSNYQIAEGYFQEEKFDQAKPYFEEHLVDHPKDKRSREYLGDIASYTGDWDSAIDYYESLVEEDDINANYHFKYGAAIGMMALESNRLIALTYIGDIKTHFEKAALLDSNHIEVRWALVEYYIQLPGLVGGSERKAIHYANELAQISPVDGYLANGYIAEYSDRPDDAEGHYKNAIKVGGSLHTYQKLSTLYEKNSRPSEAIKTNEEALEIHKRNQLNYQIGKISAQYNLDSNLGIERLHEYIENHSAKDEVPKDWAYLRLAQIYKNIDEKESAIQWINKALQSRSDFKEAILEKELIMSM